MNLNLESRKMSLRSREALNINILEWSLISVMALDGRLVPTATRPMFWAILNCWVVLSLLVEAYPLIFYEQC